MNNMIYQDAFFLNYLKEAPVALAVERTLECQIYAKFTLEKPILDIGCGEGMFARLLFKNKIDVGIDPNQEEIKRAEEYGAYDELICCYGDKIPKPDKYFKTIISNSVLEHIPNLSPVLKEAHRLLSDDGKFVVTIPTNYFEQNSLIAKVLQNLHLKSLEFRYRKFFNSFWSHYHYYSVENWIKFFKENGFSVYHHETYCSSKTGLFNDLYSPIAIFAFLQKKFFNRWFLFPIFRAPFAYLYSAIYKPILNENKTKKNDGLVFFILQKS